jgi:SUMO ligase MMS21 Smc5/6 complex component
MLEYFNEISDKLSFALINSSSDEIIEISKMLSKTSSILLRYSPFLDSLAKSINDLAVALRDHTEDFMDVFLSDSRGIFSLFDAVSSDMERYIKRFSVESIAMKNSHHIHEPTTLSILQIISFFVENEAEAGEMEFF